MSNYLKPYLDACRAFDLRRTYSASKALAVSHAAGDIIRAAGFGDPEPIFHSLPDEGHEFIIRAAVMLEAMSSPSREMAAREIRRLQDQVRQAVVQAR